MGQYKVEHGFIKVKYNRNKECFWWNKLPVYMILVFITLLHGEVIVDSTHNTGVNMPIRNIGVINTNCSRC